LIKLNLGCGYNRLDGHVNVDLSAVCSPDLVANLEEIPWPWATDSVDTVVFNHSLEHMGASSEGFLALMRELYRVCRNGATIQIAVPHPRHDNYIDDPTHVRIITPGLLRLFDRKKNDEWKQAHIANTPLAHYLGVDFEITNARAMLDEPYRSEFSAGRLTSAEVESMVRSQLNVAQEYQITLQVRK
jgi:SAM-dependent methyltransferase